MDLKDIRIEIDALDGQLAALFQRRAALSMQAAVYKKEHNLPMVDGGRERDIILRAESMSEDERMKPALRRFFEQVLAECREKQREATAGKPAALNARQDRPRVAFLGPEGSFSHEAALQYFGGSLENAPAASFEEAVEAVAGGQCRYGVLPVENSLTGGVFAAIDSMTAGGLHIAGETVLGVRHCLMGLPGATADGVTTVLSHPQPLEQCRKFIRRMGYAGEACSSTAGAAREAAARRDAAVAAISSEAAGRMHGLVPLLMDIQDNPANYTRFAIVSAREERAEGADKISAVFVVEHRPGTLYGTLRAFADRGVNLLNLVSRPVPGSPWQYSFHMDFGGSLDDAGVREALAEAALNCRSIRILGNYISWEARA